MCWKLKDWLDTEGLRRVQVCPQSLMVDSWEQLVLVGVCSIQAARSLLSGRYPSLAQTSFSCSAELGLGTALLHGVGGRAAWINVIECLVLRKCSVNNHGGCGCRFVMSRTLMMSWHIAPVIIYLTLNLAPCLILRRSLPESPCAGGPWISFILELYYLSRSFFVCVFSQYPLRWFSTPLKLTEGSGFLAGLYFQSFFSFIIPKAARTLFLKHRVVLFNNLLFKIWPWSFILGHVQMPSFIMAQRVLPDHWPALLSLCIAALGHTSSCPWAFLSCLAKSSSSFLFQEVCSGKRLRLCRRHGHCLPPAPAVPRRHSRCAGHAWGSFGSPLLAHQHPALC